MYTDTNFRTKKALKTALSDGQTVRVWQPGLFANTENGPVTLEGPHYPAPHTWYATADIENGVIVKVR
jgi:hypothetical protein